jgi:hypothetical protein
MQEVFCVCFVHVVRTVGDFLALVVRWEATNGRMVGAARVTDFTAGKPEVPLYGIPGTCPWVKEASECSAI